METPQEAFCGQWWWISQDRDKRVRGVVCVCVCVCGGSSFWKEEFGELTTPWVQCGGLIESCLEDHRGTFVLLPGEVLLSCYCIFLRWRNGHLSPPQIFHWELTGVCRTDGGLLAEELCSGWVRICTLCPVTASFSVEEWTNSLSLSLSHTKLTSHCFYSPLLTMKF